MKHASLFSGVGGFDLAAEWMGWENMFHCEWNEFGQRILKYYWANAVSYGDITKTDFTIWRGKIDILTGGFPCQPYSTAGKRLGKEDERHLWPEMLRAIREIQPSWVVGENVLGLVNWNGGLVFDEVQVDLEAQGYEVQPFILPACAVNAPHRRDRVWFVAYRDNTRDTALRCGTDENWQKKSSQWEQPQPQFSRQSNEGDDTNAHSNGQHWCDGKYEINASQGGKYALNDFEPLGRTTSNSSSGRMAGHRGESKGEQIQAAESYEDNRKQFRRMDWEKFPTQSPIRERNDGIPIRMAKYITKELQYEISNTSQENRIENLHEVRERISQKEIWEQVRRFYSLESKEVLLQTMQLYSREYIEQIELSPFSEDFSKIILQHLRKYREFRYSPQGQELQKQRLDQLGNSLSFLPHEAALAARRFEAAIAKFENWHRTESIKAYGNAIVPQVAFQIFKAIKEYEKINH